MNIEATVKNLVARVEKLEARANAAVDKSTDEKKDFAGPSGGLRLLAKNRFFEQRRTLADVTTALQSRGYHYSRQAIHIGLSRLSKKGGQLVCLNEKGKKYYVTRK